MSKACEHIRVELAPFAGGDIDGDAAEAVERHLEECESCRRECRELTAAIARLRGIEPAMPEARWRAMQETLADEEASARRSARILRLPRRAFAAAVAVLVGALGIGLWRGDDRPTDGTLEVVHALLGGQDPAPAGATRMWVAPAGPSSPRVERRFVVERNGRRVGHGRIADRRDGRWEAWVWHDPGEEVRGGDRLRWEE